MIRRTLIAALVAACALPAVAATPVDSKSAVLDALDTFCKPFIAGTPSEAQVRAKAEAAGWRYSLGQPYRQGDWGRINVIYGHDGCTVTVPVGSARGREAAILDAAGAWARKNGYSLKAPRATKAGPGPAPGIYDTLAEDWVRPDGAFPMGLRGYVNRRKPGMLIPDVSIYIYPK